MRRDGSLVNINLSAWKVAIIIRSFFQLKHLISRMINVSLNFDIGFQGQKFQEYHEFNIM